MEKLEETMNPEPSDKDEETRARGLAEQCWLGPLCLAFWVVVILAYIHGCAKGAECKLAWDAAPAAEQVTAWKIYRGIELLATANTNSATVTLPHDQTSTLAVVAVNATGESPPATITVIPFVPKHSEELRVWIAHPSQTVFVEAKPRMFMSYTFPTP